LAWDLKPSRSSLRGGFSFASWRCTTADGLKAGLKVLEVNLDVSTYAHRGEFPFGDPAPQGARVNVGVFGSSRERYEFFGQHSNITFTYSAVAERDSGFWTAQQNLSERVAVLLSAV
jgi:hypothetical protein